MHFWLTEIKFRIFILTCYFNLLLHETVVVAARRPDCFKHRDRGYRLSQIAYVRTVFEYFLQLNLISHLTRSFDACEPWVCKESAKCKTHFKKLKQVFSEWRKLFEFFSCLRAVGVSHRILCKCLDSLLSQSTRQVNQAIQSHPSRKFSPGTKITTTQLIVEATYLAHKSSSQIFLSGFCIDDVLSDFREYGLILAVIFVVF